MMNHMPKIDWTLFVVLESVRLVSEASVASENYMTILTPDDDIDIKVGQIVTPSISGYFATQSVTVTSVGTTQRDLSPYPFTGIATSKLHTVPYITVDQLPVTGITAPISGGSNDGEYVYMLFSQDPNTIDDSLALEFTDSPYVNQSIEIMSYSRNNCWCVCHL